MTLDELSALEAQYWQTDLNNVARTSPADRVCAVAAILEAFPALAQAVRGQLEQQAETHDAVVLAGRAGLQIAVQILKRAMKTTQEQGLMPLTADECITILEHSDIPTELPEQAVRAQQWQPIETLVQTQANKNILVGWSSGDEAEIMNVAEAIEVRDKQAGPPTHWMPLPAPPSPSQEA